jgi:hypothetical protein
VSEDHRFGVGQRVTWTWGNGEGSGKIAERHEEEVERTIKGSKIKRNGSKDNPAYLIEQEDGDRVLKLGSELDAD